MNVIKKFVDFVKNIFTKQETKKLEETTPINQEKIYFNNTTPINQEKIEKTEPESQGETILKNKIKIPIYVGDGLGIKKGFKS